MITLEDWIVIKHMHKQGVPKARIARELGLAGSNQGLGRTFRLFRVFTLYIAKERENLKEKSARMADFWLWNGAVAET